MHYKFLDSSDVDRVIADGTVMVSSLGYFRKLEAAEGDIGDPLEGATDLTIRHGIVATEGSPELDMLNAANIGLGSFDQLVKISGGGTFSAGAGSGFRHVVPELYIFSFSTGNVEVLTEEMCVKASRPYHACLRIKDAAAFGRACFNEGTVLTLGCKVNEAFDKLLMQDVDYLARSIDLVEGPAIPPDPFKKEVRFSPQSEVRLAFIPAIGKTLASERLVISFPNPMAHFDLVFRDRVKP